VINENYETSPCTQFIPTSALKEAQLFEEHEPP
jgi:hypothetical protein